MRFKVLALIAVVGVIAGCESTPGESGAAGGAGGAATATSGSGSGSGVTGQRSLPGPAAGSVDELISIGDRVFFDFDKYNLKPDARAALERQAAWLQRYPAVTIVIEGHCDERGTREYNLALGERRANSARDYLIALGVSANRVKTLSYGEERPVALGSNDAAWAQNRRAVTVVTGGAAGS